MSDFVKAFFGLFIISALIVLIGFKIGGITGFFIGLITALLLDYVCYSYSEELALQTYDSVLIDEDFASNEIKDFPAHDLLKILKNLSLQAAIKTPKLWIIHTIVPAAFSTGKSIDSSSIAISKGLIELLTENELKAVIAHEIGHIKNQDILWPSCLTTIAASLGFLVDLLRWKMWGQVKEAGPAGFSLMTTISMVILAPIMAFILHLGLSKQREYAADKFSIELTNLDEDLSTALLKIDRSPMKWKRETNSTASQAFATLFICSPFTSAMGFVNSILSIHPSIKHRINRISKIRKSK